MKLNSTIALTLILLILMVAAGLVSASWGIALGREALKGITQPDTRPTNSMGNRQPGDARREELPVLSETDIIANVKVRMGGKDAKTSTAPAKPITTAETSSKAAFPLTTKSQNVVLEVTAVQKEGDALIMQVNLRNNSKRSVRFLYDFLNVTSDQGQTLKATAEGLPAELPSSSDVFSGTVRVPTDSLNGAKKLALSLTDYPDKQLELRLANIPVTQ